MSTRYCLCSEATLRDLETVLKPQLIAKSSMYPCDMTNAQWQVLAKHFAEMNKRGPASAARGT